MCGLESVEIDAERKVVRFNVPEMHCTDMTGAIALAKLALPEVKRVEVRSRGDGRFARFDQNYDYIVSPARYVPLEPA